MTRKQLALQNLKRACIANGCISCEVAHHVASRSALVLAIRQERAERARYIARLNHEIEHGLCPCIGSRREHRWITNRGKKALAILN